MNCNDNPEPVPRRGADTPLDSAQPCPPPENTRPCGHACPTHQAPPVIEPLVLNIDQVSLRVNLSPSAIYRLMANGDFPASIQLSPNRVG